MRKTSLLGRMAMGLVAALFSLGAQAGMEIPRPHLPPPAPEKAPPITPVDAKKCYACHDNIEDWDTKGRHASVNCAHCHDAAEHLKTAKGSNMGTR